MIAHFYEMVAHYFGDATELLQFCTAFEFLIKYFT